uniref:hypothetical protein n=2 Tax=Vibrio TaxID=662 RepID=UPI0018F0B768
MSKKSPEESSNYTKKALPLEADAASRGVQRLTDQEKLELRRDMMESSAWAKEELARRRKNKGSDHSL